MRYLVGFVLFLLALGTLCLVGCGSEEVPPTYCRTKVSHHDWENLEDGTPCFQPSHPDVESTCLDGVCGAAELCWEDKCICYEDPCAWNGWCGNYTRKCVDHNPCTSDHCDPDTGACSSPPEPDDTSCRHEWVRNCLTVCFPGDTCCGDYCEGGWGTCQSGECV
jgi:hypothetical protein